VTNDVVFGDFYRFPYTSDTNSKVAISVYANSQRIIKAIAIADNYYDDVKNEALKKLYVRMLTDWGHGEVPVFKSSTNRERFNFEYIKITLDIRDSTRSRGGAVYGYVQQHVWYEYDPLDRSCGGTTAAAEVPRCDSSGRVVPYAAPPNQIDRETIWIAVSD
jgi:hypothetical protein